MLNLVIFVIIFGQDKQFEKNMSVQSYMQSTVKYLYIKSDYSEPLESHVT